MTESMKLRVFTSYNNMSFTKRPVVYYLMGFTL